VSRQAAAHGEHEKRIGKVDPKLARLVCGVHDGGADRDGVAYVSDYDCHVYMQGNPETVKATTRLIDKKEAEAQKRQKHPRNFPAERLEARPLS
jgi:hypothetical protein